jgi:hypothetical protein
MGAACRLSTEERTRIEELERESRESRLANEIRKAAAALCGAEVDPEQRR